MASITLTTDFIGEIKEYEYIDDGVLIRFGNDNKIFLTLTELEKIVNGF